MVASIAPSAKLPSTMPMGAILMTAHNDGLHPARLGLPFMITDRAMQTFSPGKHVRGVRTKTPAHSAARCLGRGAPACSYLANKSRVLWMIGE